MYLIVYVLGLTACSATHWGGDKCAQGATTSCWIFFIQSDCDNEGRLMRNKIIKIKLKT